jgi:hypothetical protein
MAVRLSLFSGGKGIDSRPAPILTIGAYASKYVKFATRKWRQHQQQVMLKQLLVISFMRTHAHTFACMHAHKRT